MRPLLLEIQGFTCYRDEQPPLDFNGMSLFAIAGPTGAGKSTILDAMLYALYGTMPRLVGRDAKLSEFVSHGSNVLSVRLDFQLRGKTYRLVRKAKVGSRKQVTTSATLAQIVNGAERSLANGVNEVDAEVEQLLGVDFSAFTQTVILPQNQFAAFLQAKPREQRTMLQQLLGHAVYPRMRELAQGRFSGLTSRLNSIDEQLQHLAHATIDALAALDMELAAAAEKRTQAHAAFATSSERLQVLRTKRARTQELDQWMATAKALDAQASSIEQAAKELLQAAQAAEVAPLLEVAEDARRKAGKSAEDLAAAERVADQAKTTLDMSEQALSDATAGAASLDEWRAQLRRFHEIQADVDRLPSLRQQLSAAQKALKSAERKTQQTTETARLKRDAGDTARQRVTEALAERDALGYDAGRHAEFESRMNDAASAQALVQAIERLEREITRLSAELESQQESLSAVQAEHTLARSASEQARTGRERAERARHDGVQRHAAIALRHELVAGASCPVCEQIVTAMPTAQMAPELKVLEDECVAARNAETETARTLQDATTRLAGVEAKATGLRQLIERHEHECRAKGSELQVLVAGLAVVVEAPASPGLLQIFDGILEGFKKSAAELQRREQRVATAEKQSAVAQIEFATADGDRKLAEQTLEQASANASQCRLGLDEVLTRIASVTSAEDPTVERTNLSVRIDQVSDALSKATANAQHLRESWRIAVARVESLAPITDAEIAAKATAERRLSEAMAERGFEAALNVRKAARTPDESRRLEQRIATFRTEREGARVRVDELTVQVGSEPVSASALAVAETEHGAAKTAADGTVAECSRLEERRRRLATDVDRSAELSSERTSVKASSDLVGEMSQDLRSDGFQHFLLTEAFRTLVAGASTRLREMSSRYSMEWRDDDFFVVDHDNAGERRRAETLSGGETFMASLCLALQLSAEILQASGAVRMDSLFIDEGFGGLDPVSLVDVANALDNLRTDGDRLIGIISHVPELTDRLPGCIRLEKGVGESRWVVERVG